MLSYIGKRLLQMVATIIAISVVSFIIIQLPPGDYLTTYVATLASSGEVLDQATLDGLIAQYGLDQPIYVQYFKWVWGVLQGDFGQSFRYGKPVGELIGERLGMTATISILTMLFTYLFAIPVGIYSATHKYTLPDVIVTIFGFIGLGVPGFLLALVLMFLGWKYLGLSPGGLFSEKYLYEPWSVGRVLDMLSHLWLPVVIVGMRGTAGLIRVMRASTLDELGKPYVITARAKGLAERKLIMKYPVRVALNPVLSTIGWQLPNIVSGTVIVAVVLGLPTTGPLLLFALTTQDMYLAASFILMLSVLTAIGTLLSDILLAWTDPRIRFGEK
jgi:peptide/nickel transport system permease protein